MAENGTFLRSEATKDLLRLQQVLRFALEGSTGRPLGPSMHYSGFLTIIFRVYRTPSTVNWE
jgi:hypothetical protein